MTSGEAAARRRWLAGAALFVAIVLAYLPVLSNGYIWDDDFYVTRNPNLENLEGLRSIWLNPRATPQYYPLTHTTFWIEHQVWGLRPAGYHLVNVLLHAGAAVLLWRILAMLNVPGAWVAAAVFGLHPVHVESVAWVTERKNVLSGIWYLASALAFLSVAVSDRRGPARPVPVQRYLLALACFVAALLSKTVTASLPVVLGMIMLWKRGRLERRETAWLSLMLVLGAASGLLTVRLEQHQVGATGAEFSFSAAERALIAGRAFWFYLGKLFWPFPLSFIYPRWTIDAANPAAYVPPLLAVVALAAAWAARRKIGAGVFVAASFFTVTLVPALGFFNVYPMRYSFVADHFQYLASIGPLALATAVLERATSRPRAAKLPRALGAGAILLALAVLTAFQTTVYKNEETLWRRTLETNPSAFMAHYNLAKLLSDRGRVEEAIPHYRAALEAKPDLVEALTNLANALAARGNREEAMALYRRSLAIRPDHAITLFNFGVTLEEMGDRDAAIRAYGDAIRFDPKLGAAHNNLAVLLYHRGDYLEAWRHARLARDNGHTPHPEFVAALRAKLQSASAPPAGP